jgi:hypothetical protein
VKLPVLAAMGQSSSEKRIRIISRKGAKAAKFGEEIGFEFDGWREKQRDGQI